MRRSQAERDRESLERRLEVLKLPVVPLTRNGYLKPTDRREWSDDVKAVGVGPEGMAYAVWPHLRDPKQLQVTTHLDGGDLATALEIASDLNPYFVQPLPHGRLLLADARSRNRGVPNAEVWSDTGELLLAADLGDAIEELLTTPAGNVWVGYFDEALGGSGPQGHGLARFTPELTADWLYPRNAGLPSVDDCYTLNVHTEQALICPYRDFHLITIKDTNLTDLGPAPHSAANSLLIQGNRGVFIGSWGSAYDLVTPFRLTQCGVEAASPQSRLVMPDGTEAHHLRKTSRGETLHAFRNAAWYTATLNDFMELSHST